MSRDGAPFDVEHAAARQHDRERAHPVARRPVLERRGAGRVGGDGSADARAHERRNGRIVAARPAQRLVEIDQGYAGLDPHGVGPDIEDVVQTVRGEHHFAHRRRAAGQRRLAADR